MNTASDDGLELFPEAGSAANIGIMLFRSSAIGLAKVCLWACCEVRNMPGSLATQSMWLDRTARSGLVMEHLLYLVSLAGQGHRPAHYMPAEPGSGPRRRSTPVRTRVGVIAGE